MKHPKPQSKRNAVAQRKADGKLPVSVVILTKNEEANLPGCLASLGWAAQVVVVDSCSTDRTVALARKAGAQVHVNPWPGFTAQRNFGLSKCSQPWVLSVDADERVAGDLRQGIADLLASGPGRDGYRVREVNLYFGRWLRWGGIYPGEHMILFRRQGARYESGNADVHEGVRMENPGRVRGHLVHHAYPSVELALDKLNSYTATEAAGRLKSGGGAPLAGSLVRAVHRFAKNYLWKGGILDGTQGLLYCFLTGYYVLVYRLKIWEQRRRRP